MSIIVGRKYEKNAQYIGRGSPLGNPFVMKNTSDAERNRVCDEYDPWLERKIIEKDPVVIKELMRLYEYYKTHGSLKLGCFCAPKRCHGDSIKKILDFWIDYNNIG